MGGGHLVTTFTKASWREAADRSSNSRNVCFCACYLAWAQGGLKAASKRGKVRSNIWDWGHSGIFFLWGLDKPRPYSRERSLCLVLLRSTTASYRSHCFWGPSLPSALPLLLDLILVLTFSKFSHTLTVSILFNTYLHHGHYFPCVVLWFYVNWLYQNSWQTYEIGVSNTPIVQMRELSHRRVK